MTTANKLMPDQYRRVDETLVQWCNRLREQRGHDHCHWHAGPDGSVFLGPSTGFQSRLEF